MQKSRYMIILIIYTRVWRFKLSVLKLRTSNGSKLNLNIRGHAEFHNLQFDGKIMVQYTAQYAPAYNNCSL